jgi:transposase
MALRVRALRAGEVATVRRLAHRRPASARAVHRAGMVGLAHQGQRVPAIAQALHRTPTTVRSGLTRFNCQGLTGLEEQPRSGRPAQDIPGQVREVVATLLAHPRDVGLACTCWTLDRRQV